MDPKDLDQGQQLADTDKTRYEQIATGVYAVTCAARDMGPCWQPSRRATYLASGATAFDITTAPGANKCIVLDDLCFSIDTACTVTLQNENGNVLMGWYLDAKSDRQLTLRNMFRGEPGYKLQLKTSTASAIYAYATWHVEGA